MAVKATGEAVVRGVSALWDLVKPVADDTATRMARAAEQGYDTSKVMYHGTGADVSEFDPLKMGRTDDGWFGKGFYFSPDPNIANQYANDGAPNVIPAYLRAEKPYDWRQMEGRGMRLGTAEERYDKTREILEKGYDSVDVYDEVVQLGADEKLPDDVWAAIVARSQEIENPVLPRDLVEKGLRQGMTTKADFARYYGEELANKMPLTRTLRERVVFDPSQIRSVNAAFDPAKKDSANLLAGLGGAAILGGSLAPEDAEAGVITKGGKRLIEAWHGSPHSFDKFDINKIGTGEGAQAYGHGLYFADAKDTATGYRDRLSSGQPTFEGKPIRVAVANDGGRPMELNLALKILHDEGGDVAGARATLRQMAEYAEERGKFTYARPALDRIDEAAAGFGLDKGSLYRTEIDVDPDTLLDYDKPLSEQSESVQRAFGAVVDRDLSQEAGWAKLTGREALEASGERAGFKGGGEQLLREAGIPGIRYLDGVSRNRPLKDVKREFLAELPESAEIDDVMEMLGTGQFSPKNETLLNALAEDDWLGFDYPAQAISAALSPNVGDWDASDNLMRAIADVQVENPTHNYVMFDDKPISIVERGSVDPALLGAIGVGAATTTALAPEMYRQMEETRRVVSDFAQRRAPKASFWKQKRDELLELAGAGVAAATETYGTLQDRGFIPQGTPFADFFSQRSADSQQPVRAVSALAALAATRDPQKAAGVYRMPQEQIADEAGGLVTDYLSQAGYPGIAPAAGTAVNTGINLAGF